MFKSSRKKSSTVHLSRNHGQLPAPVSPAAKTAATQAFLKSQPPSALSAAAAAATALKRNPTSPTVPGNIQTKRMIRRNSTTSNHSSATASSSVIGGGGTGVVGPFQHVAIHSSSSLSCFDAAQNQNQNNVTNTNNANGRPSSSGGGMLDRTWRAQSPQRSFSLLGVRNKSPPVPPLPPTVINQSAVDLMMQRQRASSLDGHNLQQRSSKQHHQHHQHQPKARSVTHASTSLNSQQSGSPTATMRESPRASVNFSRPLSPTPHHQHQQAQQNYPQEASTVPLGLPAYRRRQGGGYHVTGHVSGQVPRSTELDTIQQKFYSQSSQLSTFSETSTLNSPQSKTGLAASKWAIPYADQEQPHLIHNRIETPPMSQASQPPAQLGEAFSPSSHSPIPRKDTYPSQNIISVQPSITVYSPPLTPSSSSPILGLEDSTSSKSTAPTPALKPSAAHNQTYPSTNLTKIPSQEPSQKQTTVQDHQQTLHEPLPRNASPVKSSLKPESAYASATHSQQLSAASAGQLVLEPFPPRTPSPFKSALKQTNRAMSSPIDGQSPGGENSAIGKIEVPKKKKVVRISVDIPTDDDGDDENNNSSSHYGPYTPRNESSHQHSISLDNHLEDILRPTPALPSFGSIRNQPEVIRREEPQVANSKFQIITTPSSDHAIGGILRQAAPVVKPVTHDTLSSSTKANKDQEDDKETIAPAPQFDYEPEVFIEEESISIPGAFPDDEELPASSYTVNPAAFSPIEETNEQSDTDSDNSSIYSDAEEQFESTGFASLDAMVQHSTPTDIQTASKQIQDSPIRLVARREPSDLEGRLEQARRHREELELGAEGIDASQFGEESSTGLIEPKSVYPRSAAATSSSDLPLTGLAASKWHPATKFHAAVDRMKSHRHLSPSPTGKKEETQVRRNRDSSPIMNLFQKRQRRGSNDSGSSFKPLRVSSPSTGGSPAFRTTLRSAAGPSAASPLSSAAGSVVTPPRGMRQSMRNKISSNQSPSGTMRSSIRTTQSHPGIESPRSKPGKISSLLKGGKHKEPKSSSLYASRYAQDSDSDDGTPKRGVYASRYADDSDEEGYVAPVAATRISPALKKAATGTLRGPSKTRAIVPAPAISHEDVRDSPSRDELPPKPPVPSVIAVDRAHSTSPALTGLEASRFAAPSLGRPPHQKRFSSFSLFGHSHSKAASSPSPASTAVPPLNRAVSSNKLRKPQGDDNGWPLATSPTTEPAKRITSTTTTTSTGSSNLQMRQDLRPMSAYGATKVVRPRVRMEMGNRRSTTEEVLGVKVMVAGRNNKNNTRDQFGGTGTGTSIGGDRPSTLKIAGEDGAMVESVGKKKSWFKRMVGRK